MEPLKVSFLLETPMRMPDRPIHLDGLVAWAAVQEAGGDLAAQNHLPLERHEGDGDGWCWAASRLLYQVEGRFVEHSIRKHDPFEWAEDRDAGIYAGGPNKPTAGTGAYKAYQFFTPFGWVRSIEAYCIGDRDRLESLLSRISNIGKLGRLDAGRVGDLTVVSDEAAVDRWMWRTMPFEVPGYRKTHATTHPPYWKRGNRRPGFEAPTILFDRQENDWRVVVGAG